jgi:hypothetical protein
MLSIFLLPMPNIFPNGMRNRTHDPTVVKKKVMGKMTEKARMWNGLPEDHSGVGVLSVNMISFGLLGPIIIGGRWS